MRMVEGRAQKSAGHAVPRERWAVVLRDHHPGYITWEQYLRNREQMRSNLAMRGLMTPGAAKEGGALLVGLLRCGRCGRKIHISYGGTRGDVPRYHCKGGQINHGVEWCISFGGLRVDQAVVREVLEALQPVGVQAALDAWDELAKCEDEKHRSLRLALEKARYEASRAQHQYDLADPENRLVASELESRWEVALAEGKQIEARLAQAETRQGGPSEAERQRLLELGADLEALWAHPAAPRPLKKRMLRTVLEEIVADLKEDPPRTELRLHWKGGVHTLLAVPRNATGRHRNTTDHEVLDLVRELAKVCADFEITRILNRLGHRTGSGNSWTESRVRALRSYREIPACPPREERTWCTLADAAAELSVSVTVVRRLIQEGVLEGQQVVTQAPWVIARESLGAKAVQQAVRAVHEGRRVPRTVPGQTEIPGISGT